MTEGAKYSAREYARECITNQVFLREMELLIDAADAVEVETYGEEVWWLHITVGDATGSWNMDGWDMPDEPLLLAKAAERKRITALALERAAVLQRDALLASSMNALGGVQASAAGSKALCEFAGLLGHKS